MSKPVRALVLCPGRGSYQRPQLGSLAALASPSVEVLEALRASAGRPGPRKLDAAERFSPRLHIAGEHASVLTAAVSLADLDQLDPAKVDVVAVCGNSMGWYTALGYAGALSLGDAGRLIDTLGWWQGTGEHGVVGGQLVYPIVDPDWRPNAAAAAAVQRAVDSIDGLHWSIRLGGSAVLGGTEQALDAARQQLAPLERGGLEYPLRLPLHSAFHTPLMQATSDRALRELGGLGWRAPRLPLIDGAGRTWRPRWADPHALRDYTLGAQVTQPYDFTAMLRTALGDYGPDSVILPGPGSNLGGAIAQVMIQVGWRGLRDRQDFLEAQASEQPVLLSLRREGQRERVVRS